MKKIALIFSAVILVMLVLTIRASMYENVAAATLRLARDPWGLATFGDAYFGFLTFYLWVLYKETRAFRKLLWFVLIMLFGNLAMASYVLMQIFRLGKDATVESLLTTHV